MSLIVEIQLSQVMARVAEKGVSLNISPEAKTFLVEQGYVPEFGARPLKRAIQQYLVNPLAYALLKEPQKKSFEVNKKGEGLSIE